MKHRVDPAGLDPGLTDGGQETIPAGVILESGFAPVPAIHHAVNLARILKLRSFRAMRGSPPQQGTCVNLWDCPLYPFMTPLRLTVRNSGWA